jgi:hypothetical protein
MLVRRYEMPWRRAYEVYAGIGWWLALLYFVGVGVTGALPRQLALPLALVCLAMGVLRVAQALHMLVLRASLGGRGIEVIGTDDLARLVQGSGFGVPRIRLRVAARAFAAPLRARQDRLPGVRGVTDAC